MSRKKLLPVAFLVGACTGTPVPLPRNAIAASDRPAKAPPIADASSVTASLKPNALDALAEPHEQVALGDIVAAPERYLNRLVTIRGKVGVCPDLCDGIKFMCGTIAPASGPCIGYVALSFDDSPQIEVRCNDVSRKETKNALPLDVKDPRFACRGHCGNWACPGIEVGRQYQITARLRNSAVDEGAPPYTLVPIEVTALTATPTTRIE